jgi:hypothetical protein
MGDRRRRLVLSAPAQGAAAGAVGAPAYRKCAEIDRTLRRLARAERRALARLLAHAAAQLDVGR